MDVARTIALAALLLALEAGCVLGGRAGIRGRVIGDRPGVEAVGGFVVGQPIGEHAVTFDSELFGGVFAGSPRWYFGSTASVVHRYRSLERSLASRTGFTATSLQAEGLFDGAAALLVAPGWIAGSSDTLSGGDEPSRQVSMHLVSLELTFGVAGGNDAGLSVTGGVFYEYLTSSEDP